MSFFGWLYTKLVEHNAQPTCTPAVLADYVPATVAPVTVVTVEDFTSQLAASVGIPVARLKAVAEVESGGHYRWSGGRIPILFERHVFRRELVKSKGEAFAANFSASHPDLCNHTPGGYGASSEQYGKIARLIKMGFAEEAYRSASWGAFQILGGKFDACGFANAAAMVDFLHQEPVEQNALSVFAKFIGSKPPMVAALVNGDYADFARMYNGPNYAINRYDTKIAAAVAKFS